MSTVTPTCIPTNSRRTIHWLVVGHIIVGLIWGLFFVDLFVDLFVGRGNHPFTTIYNAIFSSILFSEASLLGIWGSLGTASWWKRLVGVVLGVIYLIALSLTPTDIGALRRHVSLFSIVSNSFLIIIVPTQFVVITLLIARLFDVVICLNPQQTNRIHFSIRHLMVLTVLIASLLAIGKTIQPSVYNNAFVFSHLVLPLVGGIVGVIPVWFVLATKQPALPCVGVVAVAAFVGYWLGRTSYASEVSTMIHTTIEATIIVVSLLVVRSCGYRLMRMPTDTAI